jgi:hypothetical protein
VRIHGLQAIVMGGVWSLSLYAASAISGVVTLVVFCGGAIVWLGFLVATALGHDPRLPGLGAVIDRVAGDEAR